MRIKHEHTHTRNERISKEISVTLFSNRRIIHSTAFIKREKTNLVAFSHTFDINVRISRLLVKWLRRRCESDRYSRYFWPSIRRNFQIILLLFMPISRGVWELGCRWFISPQMYSLLICWRQAKLTQTICTTTMSSIRKKTFCCLNAYTTIVLLWWWRSFRHSADDKRRRLESHLDLNKLPVFFIFGTTFPVALNWASKFNQPITQSSQFDWKTSLRLCDMFSACCRSARGRGGCPFHLGAGCWIKYLDFPWSFNNATELDYSLEQFYWWVFKAQL